MGGTLLPAAGAGAAAKIFKLSVVDMCEVARNSVLTSSFSEAMKPGALPTPFKWLQ